MLYFAYGSNLSKKQVSRRCPNNAPLKTATLNGFRLAFSGTSRRWDDGGTATVIPCEGKSVPGALYELTQDDERSLDRFEGYPEAYQKIDVDVDGQRAFTYVRPPDQDANLPSDSYIETIRLGYLDWNIPTEELDAVVTREDIVGDAAPTRFPLQPV